MSDVEEKVRVLVASTARLSPQKVPPNANLRKLGIDSLVALELVAKLEKAFKVRIPEGKIRGIGRVDHIVRIIQSLKGQSGKLAPNRKTANV